MNKILKTTILSLCAFTLISNFSLQAMDRDDYNEQALVLHSPSLAHTVFTTITDYPTLFMGPLVVNTLVKVTADSFKKSSTTAKIGYGLIGLGAVKCGLDLLRQCTNMAKITPFSPLTHPRRIYGVDSLKFGVLQCLASSNRNTVPTLTAGIGLAAGIGSGTFAYYLERKPFQTLAADILYAGSTILTEAALDAMIKETKTATGVKYAFLGAGLAGMGATLRWTYKLQEQSLLLDAQEKQARQEKREEAIAQRRATLVALRNQERAEVQAIRDAIQNDFQDDGIEADAEIADDAQ